MLNKFPSVPNGTETRLLAQKCIMEKTHLKFCYIYINNASITPKYRNGFILESCHICMDSLIISLHGNVNNSKFIKKNIPLNFDQHPPPLKT